jgi:hypothetical protein
MNSDAREQLAKRRFMMLNLARFADLAVVMAGIANMGGKFLPTLSPYLGSVLLIIGAAGFFLIPVMLKKAWARHDADQA